MKKYLSFLLAAVLVLSLTACSKNVVKTSGETVEITGIVDLVPHSEIINYVAPKLLEQGVKVTLASTAADNMTNEKTNAGEVDFNFFQHEPYLQSENEANGFKLSNAGDIHVEPITAYSDKYKNVSEIKDGATVAIPNDGTNEYRALLILEQNGFIKLNAKTANSLSASVADITENTRKLEIVELESAQIIPTKADFDFFITNTNKALEAKITSTKLFSEGGDSPYANIIAVNWNNLSPEKTEAIKKLVAVLQSDDTRKFIEEKYNGAVIPAKLKSNSGSESATAAPISYKYGKIDIPGKDGALCGAPIYIAYEKGFFAEEGFDVTLISANAETRKIGLNNGTIPIVNGDFQFFPSIEEGVKVKVVDGLHNGCIKFLVPKDSPINKTEDLKGKRIGVDEIGGTPHQVASVWLEKHGISAKQADSEVTFLPFDDGNLEVEALNKGDIDVAALWDPFGSVQEKTGNYKVIFDLSTDPTFANKYCCFLYASEKFLNDSPEKAAALLRAYQKAQDWISKNPAETVKIIIDGKYSAIEDAELATELIAHYEYPSATDRQSGKQDVSADVKYFVTELYNIGYLKTNPDTFATQIYQKVDLSLGK